MSGIGSRRTHGVISFLELTKRYYRYASPFTTGNISRSTQPKFWHDSLMHRGLVNGNSGTSSTLKPKVVANVTEYSKIRPPAGSPGPRFNISTWARWLLASIISLLVPIWKQRWDKLKKIEGEVEFVVQEVEIATEVVEKVATVVRMVSTEIAEEFSNNEKLKGSALYVERISETIAHDAQSTKDLLEKVETLKNDFNNIETMIKPPLENIIKKHMD